MINKGPYSFALLAIAGVSMLLSACIGDAEGSASPMKLVGRAEFNNPIRSGIATDGHLFLIQPMEEEGEVALHIYELDEEDIPQEVGALTAPGSDYSTVFATSSGLAVEDDVAYIPLTGSEHTGLWIVDVSDPATPQELSFVELKDTVQSVAVQDHLVAVSGLLGASITLLDVGDPTRPEILTSHSYSAASSTHVALDDEFLFVSDVSGVAIFEITSPNAPAETSFLENPIYGGPDTINGDTNTWVVPQVAVVDEYLYVTDVETGLDIFNISDPAQPEMAGQFEMKLGAVSLAISDGHAYTLGRGLLERGMPVSDLPYSLHQLDISDPEDPEIVDEITEITGIPSPLQALTADNDHLYFLNFYQVDVINTS